MDPALAHAWAAPDPRLSISKPSVPLKYLLEVEALTPNPGGFLAPVYKAVKLRWTDQESPFSKESRLVEQLPERSVAGWHAWAPLLGLGLMVWVAGISAGSGFLIVPILGAFSMKEALKALTQLKNQNPPPKKITVALLSNLLKVSKTTLYDQLPLARMIDEANAELEDRAYPAYVKDRDERVQTAVLMMLRRREPITLKTIGAQPGLTHREAGAAYTTNPQVRRIIQRAQKYVQPPRAVQSKNKQAIADALEETENSTTLRTIAESTNLNPATVRRHLHDNKDLLVKAKEKGLRTARTPAKTIRLMAHKQNERFTLIQKPDGVYSVHMNKKMVGLMLLTPDSVDQNGLGIWIKLDAAWQHHGISDAIIEWVAGHLRSRNKFLVSKFETVSLLQSLWRYFDRIEFLVPNVESDGTMTLSWRPATYPQMHRRLDHKGDTRFRAWPISYEKISSLFLILLAAGLSAWTALDLPHQIAHPVLQASLFWSLGLPLQAQHTHRQRSLRLAA